MKTNIDERFKDASPEDTVERIRRILQENNISVTEEWGEESVSHCYALVLNIDGTSFGSNGKGVTRALARASAYAELMERIQTGMLGSDARLRFSDAKRMSREELMEHGDVIYTRLSGLIDKFDGKQVAPERILEAAFEYANDKEKTLAVPFYNLNDDCLVYIPQSLMIPLYSSTGLAAGNTPEEAMVQGMSEIVERWCQRHFLTQGLVPPTIPDEYLKQYPMAYETIEQVRSHGYDIFIKDCSMGLGWPAIATVVIDRNTHAYHVHMGASPVFEIALGRSLTETFQGRVIQSVADTCLTESPKDAATYRKAYVRGRGAYPIAYFTDEPSYPFVPFEDRTQCSNRELLRYALDWFAGQGMKVYARDMSHWGFCSYQVIVPEICVSHFGPFTDDMNVPALIGGAKRFMNDMKRATFDELFAFRLYGMYQLSSSLIDKNPKASALLRLAVSPDAKTDTAVGYVHLAYADWACGDKVNAMRRAAVLERLRVPGMWDYFSCLCRAVEMCKEASLDDTMRRLSFFYDAQTVGQVKTVLAEGSNPFAPYVTACSEGCEGCRYRASCRRPNNRAIGELTNRYAAAFDNDAAFAALRTLLRSV